MSNIIELYGYHATHIKNKNNILKNGFKISNKDNEWLGHGVYFFEDIQRAKNWGEDTEYCRDNPIVIKCILATEEEKYCNLDILSNYEKLKDVINNILKISKKEKKRFKKVEQHKFMCLAINLFCKEFKIDIISYTFDDKRINVQFFPLYNSKSKQICVKNTLCIKSKEVCDDNYR